MDDAQWEPGDQARVVGLHDGSGGEELQKCHGSDSWDMTSIGSQICGIWEVPSQPFRRIYLVTLANFVVRRWIIRVIDINLPYFHARMGCHWIEDAIEAQQLAGSPPGPDFEGQMVGEGAKHNKVRSCFGMLEAF